MECYFDDANADASLTYPEQCSTLCKNDFVMIRERPCKIVEIYFTKDGKHGHAKSHITALDIFTKKKLEIICPSSQNIQVPFVLRKDYQLLSINDDNYVSLLDLKTCDIKDNLRLPDADLGIKIKSAFEKSDDQGIIVSVVSTCNEEAILSWKNMPPNSY